MMANSNGSHTLRIDPALAGPEISPLLFGHNLEHTRRAMWQGLSAQLLANRKFAGEVLTRNPENVPNGSKNKVGPDGVAASWFGIGAPAAVFAHDSNFGYAGNESQKIMLGGDASGGLGQRGFAVKKDATYFFRAVVKSDRRCRAQVKVVDSIGTTVCERKSFDTARDNWVEWNHAFTSPVTDENCQLELTFKGPATIWVGAVSLLPSTHFRGLRQDVIDLLREMSVPMLRWPGGNFTLDYRWQDGLLPVDQRPTIKAGMSEVLPHSNNCDFHEIGIDDFIALCRELNAEPFLTVNLRPQDIATPDDAAAWIEYCNGSPESKWGKVRAERGHPEPYRVKYWSIGNEIWGAHMLQTHCAAETYAQRVADYAPVMRKADPSILLTAVGIPAPVWDAIVVKNAGQYFDFLSGHDYTKPEGYERADYKRLADTASTRILEILQNTRKLIDANAPQGKRIGIAFDEWNIWHTWFAAPFDSKWQVGPNDGGFFAAALNLFCREFQNLGVSIAALFQPVNEGAIFVGPTSSFLTPVGQVFKQFRAHHNQRLIPLQADGLDACASLSADGKRLCITVASHGTPGTIALQLASGNVRGAKAVTLSAKTMATNGAFDEYTETLTVTAGAVEFSLPEMGMVLVVLEL